MDICNGATVQDITGTNYEDPLLEMPMSEVCSMDESKFLGFENDYREVLLAGNVSEPASPLMPAVTLFCFANCNFTCPRYIYSVANDSELVKERLSVFMPPAHYEYSFIVPFVVLIGALLLVGVSGNLLTIFVILKNNVLQSSSHYLVSMAFSDLLLLALTGPIEIAVNLHYWPWRYTRLLCRSRYFLIEACAFTTVLHIVTFTIERYFVICHPMRAKSLVSASRKKRVLCFIWVVSFLIAFPIFFAYDLFHACDGIPESRVCEVRDDVWEARIQKFYIFSSVILFFIPMALITVLYSLMARVMFGHNVKVTMRRNTSIGKRGTLGTTKESREDDGVEKSRRKVVKILALIAVCFFVCWCPFHVIRLMPHFGAEGWSEWFTEVLYHKWLYHASLFLLYTSSVINPFLYNIMSERFRRAMWATLCCRGSQHRTVRTSTRICSTRITSVVPSTSV